MGKKIKEKTESKLDDTPRISPMDFVEYVHGLVSQYMALNRIEYALPDGIESEWDDLVSKIFNISLFFLKMRIDGLSSTLGLAEKGLDIKTINFRDFEATLKEFIHTNVVGITFNKDSILRKYRKLRISRDPFGYHLGWDSLNTKRDREILILRIAWLCKSEYIWDHHVNRGREEGLTNDEINYIKDKVIAKGHDTSTSILISTVDDLYTDTIISEETWKFLIQQYDIFQIMDLVLTVGLYMQLSTVINTLKIENEGIVKEFIKSEGLPSFKRENDKSRPSRKISKIEPFRLNKPRTSPLNEVEYIKELLSFQNALNRLRYTKSEKNETEWEKEIDSLIQWLKNYNMQEINSLSSFLNLEEKGLDINSINLYDYKDSIKAFIKQEGTIFNLKAVMMNYRKLRLNWIILASHTTYDSSLPLRNKEILILRIAWLCRAQYEWDHHVIGGRRAGLTDEEINRIKEGSDAKRLTPFEEVLIQSVDELYRDANISDSTWEFLSEKYTTYQLMDLVFTITSYNLLAMFLNSFGIQTEDCVKDLIK